MIEAFFAWSFSSNIKKYFIFASYSYIPGNLLYITRATYSAEGRGDEAIPFPFDKFMQQLEQIQQNSEEFRAQAKATGIEKRKPP